MVMANGCKESIAYKPWGLIPFISGRLCKRRGREGEREWPLKNGKSLGETRSYINSLSRG